jgi:adenosine kinase
MAGGLDWPEVGRLAALTAVHAIEHRGTQEHRYTLAEFAARYRDCFGASKSVEALLAGTGASA